MWIWATILIMFHCHDETVQESMIQCKTSNSLGTPTRTALSQVIKKLDGASIEDNKAALEAATGLEVKISSLTNQHGTIAVDNLLIVQPITVQHITDIIKAVKDNGLELRAMGDTFTWSPMYPDEGEVLVDMSLFGRNTTRVEIIYPTYYRQFNQVRVLPNVKVSEMNEYLLSQGIALPTGPLYDGLTVGDALATGLGHGYNSDEPGLSGYLLNARLVTSDGDEKDYDFEYNPEVLASLRSHLGMCGILTEVILKVIPTKLIKRIQGVRAPLKSVFYSTTNLKWLHETYYGWYATWDILSSASAVMIRDMEQTGQMSSHYTAADDLVTLILLEVMEESNTGIQEAVLNKTIFSTEIYFPDNLNATGEMTYGLLPDMLHIDQSPLQVHSEFIFNDHKTTYTNSKTAIETMVYSIDQYSKREGRPPVHQAQLMWFNHSDPCYMCPTVAADPNLNDGASSGLAFAINLMVNGSETQQAVTFMEGLYLSWKNAKQLQFAPNFGTRHSYITTMADHIQTIYDYGILQFLRIRKRVHFDDNHLFSNTYLDSIFFPSKTNVTDNNAADSITLKSPMMITVLLVSFVMIVFL